MSGSVRTRWLVAVVALGGALQAVAADGPAGPPAPERVDRAIAAGRSYLAGRLTEAGVCRDEYPPDNSRHLHGGRTALCAYALLTAGADPNTAPLHRTMRWLASAELDGTYAVSMRACALAAAGLPELRDRMEGDVRWLVDAAHRGAYTYGARSADDDPYDNSNSQMAVLALSAAAKRGVRAPQGFWRDVEAHWTDEQQVDGGWGYFTPPGALQTRSYGSMTAAGLATMYACFDALHGDQFVRCTAPPAYEPIERALGWIGENFSARDNPRKGVEWYSYWMYSVQRVGLASGYKSFGGHDWYAAGAAELLRRQNDDGSWGYGPDRLADTAFSLLFLARGREPVAVNKLKYPGRWNARPRDAANLAAWLTRTFERPVNWQVVDIDAPLTDWQDAPILYLSGAGPFDLTDEQVDQIRRFVHRGGSILSEAACNNAGFTRDIQRLYARLFPDAMIGRIAPGHPVRSLSFDLDDDPGLIAASNGVRLLAVHSPRELSLALQLGDTRQREDVFELAGNLFMYFTGRGVLRPRGQSPWPDPPTRKPVATIRVARIDHDGNPDPEPLAWERLARLALERTGVKLEVTEPIPPLRLEAAAWPVAAMTGTRTFTLSDADAESIRRYIAAGGTLVVDAAGGSKAFTDAVEKQLLPLAAGERQGRVISTHPVYKRPFEIGRVSYRPAYALSLPDRRRARLRGVQRGDRLAMYYSPEDLTAGLVGYHLYGIRGYTPESAVELMINIVCNAAGVDVASPPGGE